MRLKRLIADRFGALNADALGELGDGLTVVLGPNEAGKTSFATLARFVLYGYPRKKSEGSDYESDAGKRLGRLVFADDEGEWSVERAEGPHGGPVAVHALSGPERPELLNGVIRGVSRDAFRIVFGFGLDEMRKIEGRESGDDVLSRLYAAQVGLDVSPQDVRAELSAEADALWRPRGKKELNVIKTRIAEVKRELGEMERHASDFADDQRLLAEMTEQRDAARQQRDVAVRRASELDAAARKLGDLEKRISEHVDQEQDAREAVDAASVALQKMEVDERVLGVAAELDIVLEDLSGFREQLKRANEQKTRAGELERQAVDALSVAGVSVTSAAGADIGPETRAGVERWRAKLDRLASQATTSRRAADAAGDSAPSRGTIAGPALTPGAVMALAGLALAAYGASVSDTVQAALGALLFVVGGAFVAQAVRLRRATPSAGSAVGGSSQAQTAALRDTESLDAAQREWREWLASRGLADAGEDPSAAVLLIDAFKEHRSLLGAAQQASGASRSDMAECEAYRERLARLVEPIVPAVVTADLAEVAAHAARVRDLLATARAARRECDELAGEITRRDQEAAAAHNKALAASGEAAQLTERIGMPSADAAQLSMEAATANEAAEEAVGAFEAVAMEHTKLATKLDNDGRDSLMAELRLELAGLGERRDEALDRYAVLATAGRLMARVQTYSEQARQPEVIRRASELFSTITSGRYVRVVVPAAGEFRVFDADARGKATSELSTGTAQQLYLALRIALMESLDAVGAGLPVFMDDVLVNFDPERKRGAAEAIKQLATHRQVVLFTCHPETATLFAKVAPDRTELALGRC